MIFILYLHKVAECEYTFFSSSVELNPNGTRFDFLPTEQSYFRSDRREQKFTTKFVLSLLMILNHFKCFHFGSRRSLALSLSLFQFVLLLDRRAVCCTVLCSVRICSLSLYPCVYSVCFSNANMFIPRELRINTEKTKLYRLLSLTVCSRSGVAFIQCSVARIFLSDSFQSINRLESKQPNRWTYISWYVLRLSLPFVVDVVVVAYVAVVVIVCACIVCCCFVRANYNCRNGLALFVVIWQYLDSFWWHYNINGIFHASCFGYDGTQQSFHRVYYSVLY